MTSFEQAPEQDKTQAYYVIKAAQEKESLQREGDALNTEIQAIERDILTLTNTLDVINGRNDNLRQSYNAADETSPEYNQKIELQEQLDKINKRLKIVTTEFSDISSEMSMLDTRGKDIRNIKQELSDSIRILQSKREQMTRDLSNHYARVERANAMISKFLYDIRRKHNKPVDRPQTVPPPSPSPRVVPSTPLSSRVEYLTDEECEVLYTERKQANRYVLNNLNTIASSTPELSSIFNQLCVEAGLSIPSSRPVSVLGSPRNVVKTAVRK